MPALSSKLIDCRSELRRAIWRNERYQSVSVFSKLRPHLNLSITAAPCGLKQLSSPKIIFGLPHVPLVRFAGFSGKQPRLCRRDRRFLAGAVFV